MSRAYNPRISKAANAALDRRYRKVQMQRFMLATAIVVVISLIVFLSSTMKAFAGSTQEDLPKHKYYKSMVVEKGDTLWDIAIENTKDTDIDINAYMNEVKSMNNLYLDEIHAGQSLIVAYYSTDVR